MLLESECWFQACGEQHGGWHLDVVSLLAVIGESIIADQAQVITSSWACLLPRLIPAPQAFLRAERPRRLPAVPGVTVRNIAGGTQVDELNYFANVIHEVDKLTQHEVYVYEISLNDTFKDSSDKQHVLPANRLSSPHILSFFSFLVTWGLFTAACILHDGPAALGIAVLALQSSLGCAAWLWKPVLAVRRKDSKDARGDIVIRTRGGAFVIVRCNEDVARQLYVGEEIAEYHLSPDLAKLMTGVATVLLMVSLRPPFYFELHADLSKFGVVLIGNARWTMQAAIGGTFVALNFLYWCMALLSRKRCWNYPSIFTVKPMELEYCKKDSYTECLFAVICRTKDEWLREGNAAPDGANWDIWLSKAYANRGDPDWPAVAEMEQLVLDKVSK